MGFLSRLFGGKESDPPKPEHAVIVRFQYGQTNLEPLFRLEQELENVIGGTGVGEYDGNEVAVDGSDGSLYMYGPDADRLFAVVRPILEKSTVIREAVATLRYGPPDDTVRSVGVRIGS
jgi:hypothetical protein